MNAIPTWKVFYETHKRDNNIVIMCVAGCDEKDSTRITVTFLPEEARLNAPENKGILVSVSENLGKKKVDYIIDNIIDLYDQYKAIYL